MILDDIVTNRDQIEAGYSAWMAQMGLFGLELALTGMGITWIAV
jgi:hypothetical protein